MAERGGVQNHGQQSVVCRAPPCVQLKVIDDMSGIRSKWADEGDSSCSEGGNKETFVEVYSVYI